MRAVGVLAGVDQFEVEGVGAGEFRLFSGIEAVEPATGRAQGGSAPGGLVRFAEGDHRAADLFDGIE